MLIFIQNHLNLTEWKAQGLSDKEEWFGERRADQTGQLPALLRSLPSASLLSSLQSVGCYVIQWKEHKFDFHSHISNFSYYPLLYFKISPSFTFLKIAFGVHCKLPLLLLLCAHWYFSIDVCLVQAWILAAFPFYLRAMFCQHSNCGHDACVFLKPDWSHL